MREMLSDANTSREDKERLLKERYACVDAKGKEKQAGASSSNNEAQEEEVLLLQWAAQILSGMKKGDR